MARLQGLDSTALVGEPAVAIPMLGLGLSHNGGFSSAAVQAALKRGIRLFDTAQRYGTERGLADAIEAAGVSRQELFLTTKVWPGNYNRVCESVDESLANLRTDYIDLVLLHWPGCPDGHAGRLRAWRELESLLSRGVARQIGVSNFEPEHLEPLCRDAAVRPAVNQIELNPFQQNRGAVAACERCGVAVQGYAPLAKGQGLRSGVVQDLAKQYERTAAQILVRYSLQKNVITIPKSTKPERIEENTSVFDFEISAWDMERLDALDCNLRVTWDPTGVE